MQEIKIYHSFKKHAPLLLVCFLFVVCAICLLISGKYPVIAWLALLLFGAGGLVVTFLMVKEKLTGRAYLVITDQSVKMNTLKEWEIPFSDVESFTLVQDMSSRMIAIYYKPNVETQKIEEATSVGQAVRKMNVDTFGTQEGIPVDGLTMKPEDICELLNERVKALR